MSFLAILKHFEWREYAAILLQFPIGVVVLRHSLGAASGVVAPLSVILIATSFFSYLRFSTRATAHQFSNRDDLQAFVDAHLYGDSKSSRAAVLGVFGVMFGDRFGRWQKGQKARKAVDAWRAGWDRNKDCIVWDEDLLVYRELNKDQANSVWGTHT